MATTKNCKMNGACIDCVENCRKRLHKSDTSTNDCFLSFFRVMSSQNNISWLMVPKRRPEKNKQTTDETCNRLFLHGPSGHMWCIKQICNGNSPRSLNQDWRNFVQDHRIEPEDVVVFDHVSHGHFGVRIFEADGSERPNCVMNHRTCSCCNKSSPTVEFKSEDVKQDTCANNSGFFTPKSAFSNINGSVPNASGFLKPKREMVPSSTSAFSMDGIKPEKETRPLNNETTTKSKPVETASDLPKMFSEPRQTCQHLQFTVELTKAAVSHGYKLAVPKIAEHNLMLEKSEAKLLCRSKTGTTAEFNVYYIHGEFCRGWRDVVVANKLQQGDRCQFTLTDKSKNIFKLSISKPSNCTPTPARPKTAEQHSRHLKTVSDDKSAVRQLSSSHVKCPSKQTPEQLDIFKSEFDKDIKTPITKNDKDIKPYISEEERSKIRQHTVAWNRNCQGTSKICNSNSKSKEKPEIIIID